MPTIYGFYSNKHALLSGASIYSKPDGSKVYVTCVSNDKSASGYLWEDKESVGEVTVWISDGMIGSKHFLGEQD